MSESLYGKGNTCKNANKLVLGGEMSQIVGTGVGQFFSTGPFTFQHMEI